MIPLVGILAVLTGVVMGLLGGGGSILAVTTLTYVAEQEPKVAIATSLLVVGVTALFATVQHARNGNIVWRTGFVFSVAAMVGGYLGGKSAAWFDGSTLLVLFASMMAIAGFAMVRPKKALKPRATGLPIWLIVIEGIVVGYATGLVGAGGGFLVVPALVILGGMKMHKALGTGLLVISMKSIAAFSGHIQHVEVDWQFAIVFTCLAIFGSFFGTRLSSKVPAAQLKKGFGWFVLGMAGLIVAKEIGGI
jgi:uncharacterized membrane protein YfcA